MRADERSSTRRIEGSTRAGHKISLGRSSHSPHVSHCRLHRTGIHPMFVCVRVCMHVFVCVCVCVCACVHVCVCASQALYVYVDLDLGFEVCVFK